MSRHGLDPSGGHERTGWPGTLALELHRNESEDQLPPARFSCSSRTAYELPVELGRVPVPGKYWLKDSSDTGVITHLQDHNRNMHLSP